MRARAVGAGFALLLVSAGVAALIAVRGQQAGGDVSSTATAASRSPAAPSPTVASPTPTPAPPTSPSPSPSLSPRPTPPARVGPPPIQRPPLTVLNNSTISGLAADSAARFRAAGWTIADIGSIRGRYRHSTVYYGPGQLEAARALVRQFPAVTVIEARSRYPNLPGDGLTVVVTRDFA